MKPPHPIRGLWRTGANASRAVAAMCPGAGVRRLCAIAVLALVSTGGAAEAQSRSGVGVLAGIRIVTGTANGPSQGTQEGVELRGMLERPLRPGIPTSISWRLELAYSQLQKPRSDTLGRYSINENGFELGAALRIPVHLALAQAYLIAGPVLSFRAACGVDSHFDSNGRVPCEGARTTAAGVSGGLGVRGVSGARLDWVGEVRLMRGTVTAGDGTVLAISAGFQRR